MKHIIFFLVIILLAGCFDREPEKTGREGQPLPSFNLLLPDSTMYFNTTSSIPAGKSVVLLYLGPYCPASRAQMKEIIENINRLKDVQFYIFTPYPFIEMKTFYEQYELKKYPNIILGMDYTNFFEDYFKAKVVPYMAIYGNDKRLNKAFIGKTYSREIKEVAEE